MAQELEARQRTALGGLGAATEPELDQFMVSYIYKYIHIYKYQLLVISYSSSEKERIFFVPSSTVAYALDLKVSTRYSFSVQEAYHEMLVKFREELTRPLQEAMEFMRRVESQLNSLSISGRSLRNIFSSGIYIYIILLFSDDFLDLWSPRSCSTSCLLSLFPMCFLFHLIFLKKTKCWDLPTIWHLHRRSLFKSILLRMHV